MIRLLVLGALSFSLLTTALPAQEAEKKAAAIELTIDFGDGFQKRYTRLKAAPKQTVLGVLKQAELHPRGIKVVSRGKGETAFVTAIDAQKNQGSGRNWIFRVNGKLGKRSCDATPVAAGDKVEWRFQAYNGGE